MYTTLPISDSSNNDDIISHVIDIVLIVLLLCLICLCCCLFFLLFRKKKQDKDKDNDNIVTTDQISVPVMENNILFNKLKNDNKIHTNIRLRDDPSDPLIDTDEDEKFDRIVCLPVIHNERNYKHNKQISAQSTIITPKHHKQISAQSSINIDTSTSPGLPKQVSAQSININTPIIPKHNKQISAQSINSHYIISNATHNKQISAQSFDGLYKRDASVKTIYKLEGKNDNNNGNNGNKDTTENIEMSAMDIPRYGEKSNSTLISKQNTVYSDISISNVDSNVSTGLKDRINKFKQVNKYIDNVEYQYKQKDKAYPMTNHKNTNKKSYIINENEEKAYIKNTNDKNVKTNNNNNNNDKAYPMKTGYNTNDTRNRTQSMKTGSV